MNKIEFRDRNGKPMGVVIEDEEHTITNNKITLICLPNVKSIEITNMVELKPNQEITDSSQYKVDYETGDITFHSNLNNTNLKIKRYQAIGFIKTDTNDYNSIRDFVDNGVVFYSYFY